MIKLKQQNKILFFFDSMNRAQIIFEFLNKLPGNKDKIFLEYNNKIKEDAKWNTEYGI